jgi:hypothetical protein
LDAQVADFYQHFNCEPNARYRPFPLSWPGLTHGCPVEFRAAWNGNLIP